jgi:hypothetical protein
MKACFLVSQRGRSEWRGFFDFQPYDYGPFDRGVYAARDVLLGRGLLAAQLTTRYPAYALTDAGRARLAAVRRLVGDSDADWLARIGRYVTSKSFSQLLDEVYAAFPEYAVRSVVTR